MDAIENTFAATVSVRDKIKEFIRSLSPNLRLVLEFAKNDFKARYLGSYLGILWAFIHPLVTIMILWFVFEVGFKTTSVHDAPFILWLMCGFIPWTFLAEGIISGSNSVVEQSYLVKKVVFRASLLPVIKLLSGLLVHIFFVALLLILFWINGYTPTLYWLQIPFYSACALALGLGLSWLLSALIVFVRDIQQVVAMALQFGFWLTPVFWSIDAIPYKYRIILKANPAYYIVEGYRDALIRSIWFWEKPLLSLYFLIVCCILVLGGAFVFIKLRPHFADVL